MVELGERGVEVVGMADVGLVELDDDAEEEAHAEVEALAELELELETVPDGVVSADVGRDALPDGSYGIGC